MYIVQFEDDEPKFAEQLTDAEYNAADDGLLTLIDISDSSRPLIFSLGSGGEWVELSVWTNS